MQQGLGFPDGFPSARVIRAIRARSQHTIDKRFAGTRCPGLKRAKQSRKELGNPERRLKTGKRIDTLVAQALYPPYRAIGYSYTLSLFVLQL